VGAWQFVVGLGVILILSAAAACRPDYSQSTGSTTVKTGGPLPLANGDIDLGADDGQWVRPAKDYASMRFSALTEINTSNVARLRPVGTFSTGVLKGHEAAPIVVGGTMY